MTDIVVKHGWHWTFGWLRRPDRDDSNGYCYEAADGDLIFTKARHHKDQLYLDCRKDEDTNENYICISPVPRRQSYQRKTCK